MSLSRRGCRETWLESLAPGVPKPNSIFSCRFTGTIVTVSIPKGSLNRSPGPTVPTNRPNRWITPTLSGPTV